MVADRLKALTRKSKRMPTTAENERIYAIGDIHGRFDLLAELMAAIGEDARIRGFCPTRLVFLGDLIDRGPRSRDVVAALKAANEHSSSVVVLFGNHEMAMIDAVAGDCHAQETWLEYGGDATLASYGLEPRHDGETHWEFAERLASGIGADVVEWLRGLPLSFRSGDYFFCHAGVRPGVKLARQVPDDLLWIRKEFTESNRDHGAIIVHGHSVVEEITFATNRIGIDTGAYRTGRLSALGLANTDRWTITTGEPCSGVRS